MIFDGLRFASAWLPVAIASGDDPVHPSLYRAVCVEFFEGAGVRLIATDGAMLLYSWVPEASDDEPEPELDESPASSIVVSDKHGRAKGLLAHVLKVVSGDNPEDPCAEVSLDVATADGPTAGQLPGLESRWATMAYPGEESIRLHVPEGSWVGWHPTVIGHTAVSTSQLSLSYDSLTRLGKVAKILGAAPVFRFQGPDKAALVTVDNGQFSVSGLVMPYRLVDAVREVA